LDGHDKACQGEAGCRCEEKSYWRVSLLSLAILVIEVGGGLVSGSLALLSDAGHVLSDLIATITSIITARRVRNRPDREDRYRSLNGLVNGWLLLFVAALIAYEALERTFLKPEIVTRVMIVVSVAGAFGNFWQRRILRKSHADHLTHEGMVLHVDSDFWQSLMVVAAAILIAIFHYHVFDTLASLFIVLFMLKGGAKLTIKSWRLYQFMKRTN